MENYRTFVGIPLKVDLAFLEALDRLRNALAGERISWVKPKNYHLTLRFLGDTPLEQVEAISEAFVSGFTFQLYHEQCLAGPGVFGPRKKPRVLWVGFTEPDFFLPLRKETELLLSRCGIEAAEGDFNPHLTLGRIRGLKDPVAFHEIVETFRNDFRTRVSADRLIFYRSELTPDGPRYSSLVEIPFSDSN